MSFETMAGVFVYCHDFHSGQASRLYRLLSKIRMRLPNSAWEAIRHGRNDLRDEWLWARMVYRRLKRRKAS